MKTKLLIVLLLLMVFEAPAAIIFFTDKPNSPPVGSDFFALQRNRDYINSSFNQVSNVLFLNPVFTGIMYGNGLGITNINATGTNANFTYITNFTLYSTNITANTIITTNVTINFPGGFTNLNLTANSVMKTDNNDAESSVPNAVGVLTNNGIGGIGFNNKLSLTEIDALNFYPTNLFTGLTNYNLLGTDANGLLTLGSGVITNIIITNAYIQNLTNNTFVNTNVVIVTSNSYFYNSTITNANITNLFFLSGKGNTLTVTNVFIGAPGALVNSNTANNSAVITDSAHAYTNAANAHGVFTNSASGPPSFGLLQNTELVNSSITIQGSAVALGGSTLAVGSSPQFNGQQVTNVLTASISSPTNGVSTASSIDFSIPEAVTNIAGAVSQTSMVNFNQTNINHAIRYYVNRTGSDQTITVGTWETDSGRQTATTYINTNNTTLGLMFTLYAGQFTNVTSYKTFR